MVYISILFVNIAFQISLVPYLMKLSKLYHVADFPVDARYASTIFRIDVTNV